MRAAKRGRTTPTSNPAEAEPAIASIIGYARALRMAAWFAARASSRAAALVTAAARLPDASPARMIPIMWAGNSRLDRAKEVPNCSPFSTRARRSASAPLQLGGAKSPKTVSAREIGSPELSSVASERNPSASSETGGRRGRPPLASSDRLTTKEPRRAIKATAASRLSASTNPVSAPPLARTARNAYVVTGPDPHPRR